MALEELLITGQLARRPVRPIQSTFMNSVVVNLNYRIAENPSHCLQDLAEAVIELTGADAAGASLSEKPAAQTRFRWHALAGQWARRADSAPRDAGLTALALERSALVLVARPERHIPGMAGAGRPIVEAMLAPIIDGGGAAGALWAVSLDEALQFDAQDAFMLEELARMAPRSTPRAAHR